MSWSELANAHYGERRAPAEKSQGWPDPRGRERGPQRPADGEESLAPAAADRPAAIDRVERRISQLESEIGSMDRAVRDRIADMSAAIMPRIEQVESELESSIAVLFEHIGRLDDKLAAAETRFKTETDALRSRLESMSGIAASSVDLDADLDPGSGGGESIALNTASFDELRGLGLSVTQASRVIAFRDTYGAFRDFAELEEIRGLSGDDLQVLRTRTRL